MLRLLYCLGIRNCKSNLCLGCDILRLQRRFQGLALMLQAPEVVAASLTWARTQKIRSVHQNLLGEQNKQPFTSFTLVLRSLYCLGIERLLAIKQSVKK